MSSSQPRREAVSVAREHDDVASSSARASTLDEDLHPIKRWERGSGRVRNRGYTRVATPRWRVDGQYDPDQNPDMAVGSCLAALLTLVVVPALSPWRSRDPAEHSDVAERLHPGPPR